MRTHSWRLGLACALPLLTWAAAARVSAEGPVEGGSGEEAHAQRSSQSREGGSQVPCAVPLTWRLARVDREFGLAEREAIAALETAADLWERATGRDLFRQGPDGFPVRFVFDDRQAAAQRLAEQRAEVARAVEQLDAVQSELASRAARHEAARAAYTERQRAFDERVAEHNALVRQWNQRGGAPVDVEEGLRATSAALESERSVLVGLRDSLETELESLRRDEARLVTRVEEHNRRVGRAAPAAEAVESGVYRESVRMENGRLASVSREIRIYRFSTESELVLVAAHEMGHALGLGHVGTAGAIMSEEHRGERAGAAVAELPRPDLEQLRAICPSLTP